MNNENYVLYDWRDLSFEVVKSVSNWRISTFIVKTDGLKL